MNQKELSLEFINRISNQNYQEFYRFFTKDTTYYLIDENKEVSYQEILELLMNKVVAPLEIKRVLESKVCVKIETKDINFYFDVKRRRIARLEIEFIK